MKLTHPFSLIAKLRFAVSHSGRDSLAARPRSVVDIEIGRQKRDLDELQLYLLEQELTLARLRLKYAELLSDHWLECGGHCKQLDVLVRKTLPVLKENVTCLENMRPQREHPADREKRHSLAISEACRLFERIGRPELSEHVLAIYN